MKHLAPLLLFIVTIPALAACNSPQRQTQSARDALAALKKVKAAGEVGMTYEQFSTLVIEAKAKTNDAMADLPDGGLRIAMSNAIGSYADAVAVWQMKVKRQPLCLRDEPGRKLIPFYSIQIESSCADHDTALTEILRRADYYVLDAARVFGSGDP